MKERFDHIQQTLESGHIRALSDKDQIREVYKVSRVDLCDALDCLYRDAAHPDISTIVAAYHAMVQAFPKVGSPLYQREYDEFFHFFKSIYDAMPEESEDYQLLSAVKSDYIKQLTDNLSERDDETSPPRVTSG